LIAALGGAAVAWPVAARAQQPAMPVVGFLHFGSPDLFTLQATAFGQGLKETGYIERQSWAEGRYDRLPSLASDLVSRKVDLIAAFGPPSATAAKNATSTIPIVFTVGFDPVQDGLLTSLARPSGNLTGISMLAVQQVPKRLELVSSAVRAFASSCNASILRRIDRRASDELLSRLLPAGVRRQPWAGTRILSSPAAPCR